MVSVIIPTHKRLELLPRAVRSVINQTYQDLEIIIVDDAEDGDAEPIVRGIDDHRIRYCRNERKKGAAGSRNTGISKSKCDYIAFLDDDDEWLPEKLEKQMAAMLQSSPAVGWVYTGYFDVDEATGKVVGEQRRHKKADIFKDLMVENCVGSASTVLLRKGCLSKVGVFDEVLPCSEDYDLWIRIAKEYQIECIPEPLFRYSIHQKKITTNSEAQARGIEIMRQKHKNTPISPSYFGNAYNDLGIAYCLAGDMNRGRQMFWKAIQVVPNSSRGYVNFCLTLLGLKMFRRLKDAKIKMTTLPTNELSVNSRI